MKVDFLGVARRELDEAVGFYKAIDLALGTRFLDQAEGHSRWIKRFPEVASLRKGNFRRVNMKGFPYYLAYVVRGKMIWIVAVAHAHRDPDYWKPRLKDL